MTAEGTNQHQGSTALAETRAKTMDRLKSKVILCDDGETCEVGRLSIDQLATVARLVAVTIARGRKEMLTAARRAAAEAKAAAEAAGPGPDGQEAQEGAEAAQEPLQQLADALKAEQPDLVAMAAVFDGKTLREIVGAVIEQDAEWVKGHVFLPELMDIAAALLEVNQWGRLREAFLRLLPSSKASQAT